MGGGNSLTHTFVYAPSKAGRFGSVLDFFVPLSKGGQGGFKLPPYSLTEGDARSGSADLYLNIK